MRSCHVFSCCVFGQTPRWGTPTPNRGGLTTDSTEDMDDHARAHRSIRRSGPLDVEVYRDETSTRVVPVGELDMSTVATLEATLADLYEGGCKHMILDLRQLGFMDSTGLHLAVGWHTLAQTNGLVFSLIQGPPAVRRVFEVSGLLDELPFVVDHDAEQERVRIER